MNKAKEFLARVRWVRLAKLIAVPAAAMALGLPPGGITGDIANLVDAAASGGFDGADVDEAMRTGEGQA